MRVSVSAVRSSLELSSSTSVVSAVKFSTCTSFTPLEISRTSSPTMSVMVSLGKVNHALSLLRAMPLRLISLRSKSVILTYTTVSSILDRRDPPVRTYMWNGLLTAGFSWRESCVINREDTFIVSEKLNVKVPLSISRSNISRTGLIMSTMYTDTGRALLWSIVVIDTEFMSVMRPEVIEMYVVTLEVASWSSLLMRLRSSSLILILICKLFVLLDSPPVRVYEVPVEILRLDCNVIAMKSRLLLRTGSSNSNVRVPLVKSKEKLISIGGVISE